MVKRLIAPLLSCVLLSCAMSLASLHGQTPLETRLSRDITPAPKQLGEVPEADQKLVISKVAELLNKHLTFRADGTSSAFFHTTSGRQSFEWRNLRIKTVAPVRLSEADKLNGIQKRYHALLMLDASRQWDARKNQWKDWGTQAPSLFPSAITVQWKGRLIEADGGPHLSKFRPGPSTSVLSATGTTPSDDGLAAGTITPAPATQQPPAGLITPASGSAVTPPGAVAPASGSSGLPPGMSRGK